MNSIRLATFTTIIVLTLACGLAGPSRAAAPDAKSEPHLSHFVHFELGGTWLRDGDKITIDEIHGTSDTISPGNLYEIKGTYTLASHPKATLAIYTTSNSTVHDPCMNTQSMTVDQGDGHFTLYWYMFSSGNPHLSFYPADGGSSFTAVYFGTGDSVLKHVSWLDDATH